METESDKEMPLEALLLKEKEGQLYLDLCCWHFR